MAKSPRQSGNQASSQPKSNQSSVEMTGLQKAAWWSVPSLGFVALACASTLAVLFAIRPAPKAATTTPRTPASQNSEIKNVAEVAASKPPPKEQEQPKPELSIAGPTEPAKPEPQIAEATKVEVSQQALPPAPAPAQPTPTTSTAGVPQVASTAAGHLGNLTSLLCVDGSIEFFGDPNIEFAEQSPEIEKNGKSKFERLTFNGIDQSVELPDVPKELGSLEIVAKLPENATSILLDCSFQRLTLRKNREGLRWRIAGTKKQDKIKLSPKPVDFSTWHQYVITWQSGGDAILYVDGVEHDRTPYVNEQPRFPNFEKVVLGRTRGFDQKFYRSKVHRYSVYDRKLSPDEIANQSKELTQTFPAFFKQ